MKKMGIGFLILLFFVSCSFDAINIGEKYISSLTPDDARASGISNKIKLDYDSLIQFNPSLKTRENLTLLRAARLEPGLMRGFRMGAGTQVMGVFDKDCVQAQRSSFTKSVPAIPISRVAKTISLSQSLSMEDLSVRAEQDPCLLSVSNEGVARASAVPNDPMYGQQLQMSAIEAASGFDIFYPTSGSGGITADVVIAVIDTGVDYTHPDLAANMWKNASGQYGYDFAGNDTDPLDDQGHGTHVSGLAAAVRNNSVGVSGVMGTRSKIMAVKVLGSDGSGSYSAIVNGIRYATQNRAEVINMSLGGPGKSPEIFDAMREAVNAGIFVAVAAGNDGAQLSETNFESPAGYGKDLNGMMAVASVDAGTLNKSSFSNYSTTYVEIAAPGSNGILSTTRNGSYGTMQGTSMASPVLAGIAGLAVGYLKTMNVSRNAALIESLLFESAVNKPALNSYVKGGKLGNVRTLAQLLQSRYGSQPPVPTPTPGPTPEPTPGPTPTPTPPMPTPRPTPPTVGCDGMNRMECDVLNMINYERRYARVGQLRINSRCVAAAQYHAGDMAAQQYLSHDGRNETFAQRMERFGLSGGVIGQNIAAGYNTPRQLMVAIMRSPDHRRNVLDSRFASAGIGVARASNGVIYWVQCLSGQP